jgi:hypothetical protein
MARAYSFTYYWNARQDEKGRFTAFFDGHKSGDPLQIAYRGLVEVRAVNLFRDSLQVAIAETLFGRFNDPDRWPADYRGPSMTVGNVLEIQGSCFAVAAAGFEPVDIWESPIGPGPRQWYSEASVQTLSLLR